MHTCTQFVQRDVVSPWAKDGHHEVRYVTLTPVCKECGTEQPTRKGIRPYKFLDRRTSHPTLLTPGAFSKPLAQALLARAKTGKDWIPWKGLSAELATKDPSIGRWQQQLEEFLEAGWVSLRYRRQSNNQTALEGAFIVAREELEELVAPGAAAARVTARQEALADLGDGPVGSRAKAFLEGSEWESWPPDAIPLLVVLATHADSGRRLPVRFLSGTKADHTKQLEEHQARLERVLGPFEDLGLRGFATLDLLGGTGKLRFDQGAFDVNLAHPYGGLTVQQLRSTRGIEPGPGGVCFIENKEVFESACYGELRIPERALIVCTQGQPSEGVQHLAELAARKDFPLHVWCDLDPTGILIARLLRRLAGRGEALFMSVEDYLAAAKKKPIQGVNLKILADLSDEPFLGPLTVAMRTHRHWVEHETQMLTAARVFKEGKNGWN